jgi:hypothetical protein
MIKEERFENKPQTDLGALNIGVQRLHHVPSLDAGPFIRRGMESDQNTSCGLRHLRVR